MLQKHIWALCVPACMMAMSLAVVSLIFIVPSQALAAGGQERVAYYGNWSIYGNGYTLKDMDRSGAASRITTLMYAFQNVSTSTPFKCFQTVAPVIIHPQSHDYDGTGAGDAWADYQVAFGTTSSVSGVADGSEQALRGNFNQILQLKQKHPHLKVMVSIGGWTFSKFISDAAMSTSSRETFVTSCIDMFIHGDLPTGILGSNAGGDGVALGVFDGIDIDWEYPGVLGNTGNHYDAADTENFTKLLAEFRTQLDAAENVNNVDHYYLTAAVPAGGAAMSKIETDKIEEYLDWVGVMTYDMHGAWEANGPTTFQAPLFPSASPASTTLSVAESAQSWINGGWTKNKLVIGVPFYWRGWGGVGSTNNGLYQTSATGTQIFELSELSGVAHYKELLGAGLMNPNYIYYDSNTHSPWIYDGNEFWTGDTPATLTEKAAWIRDEGFLGAMIYSLESDDPSATLVKAVYTGLTGGAPAPIPSPTVEKTVSRTSQSSQNTATNGEPINMIGGNYLATRHEFQVPNRDLPVHFTLSYNSAASGELTSVGWGWTHNYRVTAVMDDDGSVVIQNPDGRFDRFTYDGSGGYDAPSGIFDTLASSSNQFEVTHKDGTIYSFNTDGLLATIESPNGNTQTLTYDENNMLGTTTDSVGRSFTFEYNDFKQLITVVNPEGREVSYEYDDQGNLVKVTNPENEITTYVYDNDHHILEVIDPRANTVVDNTYDDEGRVIEQTNALNDTVLLTYATGTTYYVDARGATTTYLYDGELRLTHVVNALGGTTTIEYDTAGNPEEVTDPLGRTTTRTYDTRGNLTEIEDALENTQTFTYDSSDNLLTRTDELGRVTRYVYDTYGNVTHKVDPTNATTTFAYDTYGQLTSVTDPLGNVSAFVYDTDGNLVTKTDAEDRNTYLGYDNIGRLVALANADLDEIDYTYDAMDRIVTVLDAEDGTTTTAYDADGNKTSVTDANGHTTSFTYDANNNLTKTTNANDDETIYAYDANGNLVSKTDANDNVTTYEYDLLNRQIKSTDPLNKVTEIAYDAVGNVVSRTDASDRETTYAYDDLNRLLTTTYPDSSTVTRTYNDVGNLTQVVGTAGTSTYTYDSLDRLTSKTDPHGAEVEYEYDANGNITEITYPDNKTVTYTYDDSNLLLMVTDWNGGVTSYTYDTNARLTGKTMPNGVEADYVYDDNGLLAQLAYSKDSTAITTFDYDRDAIGNILEDNETLADTSELWTGYTYDALNQLTLADAPTNTYYYSYDAVGNRASSTASAVASAYTYNDGNQLTAMNSRSFTYDNQGNEITDGSKTLSYNYDNQLVSFASAGGSATSTEDIYTDATTWNDWSWDVTNDFNETSVVFSGGKSIKVTYTSAWGGLYLEDATGVDTTDAVLHFAVRSSTANPLIEIDAYGPSDTQLGYVTVDSYISSMSANTWYEVDIPLADLGATSTMLTGFVAMRSTTGTLYFDDIQVVTPGTGASTSVTFVYDALGNRIEKNLNGTPTYEYVNGPGEHVLVETNVVTTTDTYYLYGLDLISQGGTASTSREYYLTDGQGNVRYITDHTGAVTASFTYDPYGNVIDSTGSSTTIFGFQTQQQDVQSGLTYLRARYYDASTGRFTSVDPFPGFAEDPTGQNGYNYANNDPINLSDPTGLAADCNWGSLPGESIASPGSLYSSYSGGVFAALNNPIQAAQGFADAGAVQKVGIGVGLAGQGVAFVGGVFTGTTEAQIGLNAGKLGTVVANSSAKIAGFTPHGLNQVISRSVSPKVLLDTVRNPLITLQQAGGNMLRLTSDAGVVLNRTGKVVTSYTKKEFLPHVTTLLKRFGN